MKEDIDIRKERGRKGEGKWQWVTRKEIRRWGKREEDKVREGKLGTKEEEKGAKNDGMIIELPAMDNEKPKGLVRKEEE